MILCDKITQFYYGPLSDRDRCAGFDAQTLKQLPIFLGWPVKSKHIGSCRLNLSSIARFNKQAKIANMPPLLDVAPLIRALVRKPQDALYR